MSFIVENLRTELLYHQFLDWRMGLDDVESAASLRELYRRERVTFATWLRERNEAPCVH